MFEYCRLFFPVISMCSPPYQNLITEKLKFNLTKKKKLEHANVQF